MRTATVIGLALVLLPTLAMARSPETLDHALAGRAPGKPQQCIPRTQIDDVKLFDSGDILYEMRGGPDYLNTPDPKCYAVRHDRQTITSIPSTSVCRGDTIQVADFVSHTPYGSCILNDFVPYAHAKKVKNAQ